MVNVVIESIVRLVVVMVVVLVILNLFIYKLNPLLFASEVTKDVTAITLKTVYENIPCMINCYTDLQGDELTVISQGKFTNIDGGSQVIDWFPCNNKVLTIAVLVDELAKYHYRSGELVYEPLESGESHQSKTFDILYDCLTKPNTNIKCRSLSYSFSRFCKKDDYLYAYAFLPCESDKTFIDYVSKGAFVFDNRKGADIDNNFVCDESSGFDCGQTGCALCSVDSNEKYDFNTCWPTWAILSEQESTVALDKTRGMARGRCEDFSLLYYSLFRAIDTPANDMYLDLSVCDLPCPCKELFNRLDCDVEVYATHCFAPSSLEFVDGTAGLSGCDGIEGVPDDEADAQMRVQLVKIGEPNSTYAFDFAYELDDVFDSNSFTYANGGTKPIKINNHRLLSLDADYTNDVWSTTFGGHSTSSTNLFTDTDSADSNGVYLDKEVVVGSSYQLHGNWGLSHTDYVASDEQFGLPYRVGVRVKVKSLSEECGGEITIGLGVPGDRTYYRLILGEERGIEHEGFYTGRPSLLFKGLDGCEATINVIPDTAGLIFSDVCAQWYDFSHSFDDLMAECNDYFVKAANITVMPSGLNNVEEAKLTKDYLEKICNFNSFGWAQ